MGNVVNRVEEAAEAVFNFVEETAEAVVAKIVTDIPRAIRKLVDDFGSLFAIVPEHPVLFDNSSMKDFEKLKEEFDREQAKKAREHQVRQADHDQREGDLKKKENEAKAAEEKIKAQIGTRYEKKGADLLIWVRQQAVEKLGLDFVNDYNIGITGPSGTGKTSLINSFRGLKPTDPMAAHTGTNEATEVVAKYPHPSPEFKSLVLWDCPGVGTLNHPRSTYFQDKFLAAFDYLLFVCSGRIREDDIDLMKQAISHKVPFAFIRNKANNDLNDKCNDTPGFDELPMNDQIDIVIKENHEFMRKELRKGEIASSDIPPCFVINSRAFVDEKAPSFEEGKLIQHVLKTIYERRNSGKVTLTARA